MSEPPALGVRVSLSSGESFYIENADPEQVARSFRDTDRVTVGSRIVYPAHVTQLVPVQIPSIEIPEQLEEQRGDTD